MLQTYTYSGNDYTDAAQGTTVFALTSTEGNAIPYLQRAHIHVYISADDGDTWTEQARPNDWDFNREGTSVVLETGIDDGEWVRVLRITPILNRFVDFADGSLLTAAQLDQGEDYSRFCDQELSDSIANETASALRYMGQIDLTADNAPGMPQPGDVYINTGDGTTIQGGDPGWVGIVGDEVSGGEQVVYQADLTWAILQTPASQVGVLSVTGTAPITVDNSDSQNPIVGFSDAPNDGVQYVRQGVGDPRVVSWAAVNIPPGTIIADPLPDGPHEAGQLGYNTGDNRLYIWVFNTDDPPVGSWVDASPVGSNMPTGGGSEDAFYENTATIDEDYSITETKNAGTFGPITVNGAVTVPDGSAWTVVGGGEGGGGGGDLWVRNGTTLSPRSSGDNLDDIGNINAASVTGSGSITTTSDIVSGGEWGVDNETSIQSNFGFGVRRDSGGQVFAAYKDAYGDAGRTVLISSDGSISAAGGKFTVDVNGEVTVGNTQALRLSYNASNARVLAEAGKDLLCQTTGQQGCIQQGSGWVPAASERKLKTDITAANADDCWDSIKDIQLHNFYYRTQEDKTGVPYLGPIVDELETTNPDLVINAKASKTFNQPLLEMKAIQALQTALTRIEALEAKLTALSGPSTTDIQEGN